MKPGCAAVLWIMLACAGLTSARLSHAAEPSASMGISQEATTALEQMGKSLVSKEFSFKAQTIRVYPDDTGQHLHIFHTMKATVRRPDRLAVHLTGDDGSEDVVYDGKTVTLASIDKKKYVTMPAAPGGIQSMLAELMVERNVDFPLADFFADAPSKAFLSDVQSGSQVGTTIIDGVEARHLFFSQKGGIDLELWLDKTEQALPRRLIVTYRMLPGHPNFIALFSDWNLTAHPGDAEFAFKPPAGMTKSEIEIQPASSSAQGTK